MDADIISYLATACPENCVGVHLIAPKLEAPSLVAAPWAWAKWAVARFFRAGICGYDEGDWEALGLDGGTISRSATEVEAKRRGGETDKIGRLTEPNALAYALCDSPVGMLALILRARALLGGDRESGDGERRIFSPEQLITATMLAWLPGPEHALRFWAGCENYRQTTTPKGKVKPKVGITIFQPIPSAGAVAGRGYTCPAWASITYDVVCTRRQAKGLNEKMGLLAFTHPEIIIDGTRGLAKALLEWDAHTFAMGAELAPLEKVVVVKDETEKPAGEAKGKEKESGGRILQTGRGGVLATLAEEKQDRQGEGENRDKDKDKDKGKGKEKEKEEGLLSPPVPIPVRDTLSDGESPDTLVEGSRTPVLEKTT